MNGVNREACRTTIQPVFYHLRKAKGKTTRFPACSSILALPLEFTLNEGEGDEWDYPSFPISLAAYGMKKWIFTSSFTS
jgi:hypothetical protein